MPNIDPRPDRPVKTRTSGSEGPFCRWCEAPITGRRRSGFCGDRCRMRAQRGEKEQRVVKLLADADGALAALRAELLPRGQETDRDV